MFEWILAEMLSAYTQIAVALNFEPEWISDYTVFERDADGWAIHRPNAETQIVYVDATNGDDATALIYDATDTAIFADPFAEHAGVKAFKNHLVAYAAMREDKPDWILFKKGEYWDQNTSEWYTVGGKNNTERHLIGAYGSSTVRPIIDSNHVALRFWNGKRYLKIVGVDFYNSRMDPAHANFLGWHVEGANALGISGYDSGNPEDITPNGYIYLEDVRIRYFTGGFGMSAGGVAENLDIQLFRCQILNCHNWNRTVSVGFGGIDMHSWLNECFLYHNGWYKKIQVRYSTKLVNALTGVAETVVTVDTPIPAEAPAAGGINLFLPTATIVTNVTAKSPDGLTLTVDPVDFAADTYWSGSKLYLDTTDEESTVSATFSGAGVTSLTLNTAFSTDPVGQTVSLIIKEADVRVQYTSFAGSTYNIVPTDFTVLDARAGVFVSLVGSEADSRNHNHYCARAKRSIRSNNISIDPSSIHFKYSADIDTGSTNEIVSYETAMYGNLLIGGEVVASYGGNISFDDGPRFRDFRYQDNVSMWIGKGRNSWRSLGWGVEPIDNIDSVISHNYFLNKGNPDVYAEFVAKVKGHSSNISINDNVSTGLNSVGKEMANPIDLTDNANFSNVTESNNLIEPTPSLFAESTRDIETYMASIGETPTLEEFALKCRAQSRDNWDVRFTAKAVNDFIKAGITLTSSVVIMTQPVNQAGLEAPNAGVFTVSAFSFGTLTYQWYDAATDELVVGATSDTYNTGATTGGQTGSYYVVVSDGVNTAQSDTVNLSVSTPAVGKSLLFNNANIFLTFAGTFMAAGEKLRFKYKAATQTSTGYAATRGGFGSGTPLSSRASTYNRWYWSDAVATITINGVSLSSGAQVPANFDNTLKQVEITSIGSGFGLGAFGVHDNLTQDFFSGFIWDIEIDKTANGGGITPWAINSEAIDGQTEAPISDPDSLGLMTIHGAGTGDWMA
jgi:hypothetical protein